MADFDTRDVADVLDFYYQSFRDDVALMSGLNLANTRVSQDQTSDIRDLNGKALFRDYAIVDSNGAKIGLVRSSGVGAQLPLIDAIFVGRLLYDERTVEAGVIAKAGVDYPGATFASKGLVCYGYPRVGVRLTVTGSGGGAPFDVVYDAHMASMVREIRGAAPPAEAGFAAANVEGEPFYSYSARLPEAGGGAEFAPQWGRALDYIRLISRSTPGGFRPSSRLEFGDAVAAMRAEAVSPADRKPAMRGITLPIPLIGQETPVYCAVATGQMILNYIGVTGLTQQQIATAFRTTSRGTLNEDMIAGLATLTAGRWSATLDEDPTADKTAQYLAGFVPGKSGIYGHARLMRGWREYIFLDPNSGRPFLTTSFYLVNDPYPTNAGQYAMEAVNKPIPDFYRNLLQLVPPPA
ncbi:hypothetical protein [Bradyrhizobium sp.]|uniref:hypothetical protein n=1 Tax=Bradyrhizobium sp. TaxID=376 RepID=UPI004037FE16